MYKLNLVKICLSAGLLAGVVGMSGCGNKNPGASKPVIIVYGGYYGYYSGSIFCDYTNDYCGTGTAWGISENGCYYDGIDTCNNNGTGNYTGNSTGNGSGNSTGNSTGNGSGNSTGNSTGNGSGNSTGNSTGNGSGNSTGNSTGNGSGNSTGNSTGNGSGNSTGNSTGNGSGNSTGNSTGNGSGTGNYTGNSSGNSSGNGSGNNSGNGSGNGSGNNSGNGSGNGSGNNSGYAFNANAMRADGCTSVDGCVSGADMSKIQLPGSQDLSNSFSNQATGFANSIAGDTKDVDLQRADLQSASLDQRSQSFAASYNMSSDSARQLVQIADRMQALTNKGQMTDEDRDAITHAALGVAGLSTDDVNGAINKVLANNGDQSALDDLMNKAATHLGMSSSAGLRDQLLPALGINLNQAK